MSKSKVAVKRKAKITPDNLEEKLTDSYCENIVDLADITFTEMRRIIMDTKIPAKDKRGVMQLVLEASQLIKRKETIFQFNQQINTQRSDKAGAGQSFESILRRLEARQDSDIIDIKPDAQVN